MVIKAAGYSHWDKQIGNEKNNQAVTELDKCGNSVMTEEVFQICGENKIFDHDRASSILNIELY